MEFGKKEVNIFLAVIGLLLLLSGCAKNANQKGAGEIPEITGSVIEDAKENCRLNNESDCRPIEIRKGEAENEQASDTQETATAEKNVSKKINISEESLLSNCEEGWKCVEKGYRAYQYANCSWILIEYCIYGCKNGTCNPAPICKLNSFKCDNDNTLKCADGYEWTLNESCDYKCMDGFCISKNATIANDTNSTLTQNLTNTANSNDTNTSNNSSNSQNNICDNNCIAITNFQYNGGNDSNCQYLNNEYVTFRNSCSYSCDLTSWTVNDASSNNYIFPAFTLDNGNSFTLHTGKGNNTQTDLYWNRCQGVWNNVGGDTLYLKTQNGVSVLICPYPNNGSISNCPDL